MTIDEFEAAIINGPRVDCPVTNRFTPGLYIREIFMPAGAFVTSMEHKTEHPFVISKGKVMVTSENEGQVIYEAPHIGVTTPGTRRALYIIEDTVWTTFHVTDETDVEKIGLEILAPHNNILIEPDHPSLNMWNGGKQPTNLIKE
jgi:hypothetical protein